MSTKSTRPEATTVDKVNGSPEQERYMQELEDLFTVDTSRLEKVKDHFIKEMRVGLSKEGHTLPMIPSYVEGRLTGEEKGNYLALDLGGTNLRVVLVTLEGQGKFKTTSMKRPISEELKTGPMANLCDYIADFIDTFVTENGLDNQETEISLGFTFSFPVQQSKINRGTVLSWTKGFKCSGAVGKDPVILLQDALLRKHVPVKITALVNDTVGTLLSNAYNKPDTLAGLILGTGANGAYIEQMDKIGKWEEGKTTHPEMIINMEFGAFDNERHVLPLTRFDNKVDRESINPNSQIFEKMLSGMYLGEIARNVLTDMIDRELIFQGAKHRPNEVDVMSKHWGFETEFMSIVEGDSPDDLTTSKATLENELNMTGLSEVDLLIIKKVCQLVGTRAARLAGCAIASIVTHCGVGEDGAAIGIDGSLYEFYPSFESRMYGALEELLPQYKGKSIRKAVRLGLARDGSGVGAALTACVAARTEEIAKRGKSHASNSYVNIDTRSSSEASR